MVFQVSINEAYRQEFLSIVNSMKKKGIVSSIQENTSENEGFSPDLGELLAVVKRSKADIKAGRIHSLEEVRRELLEDF